MKFFKNLFPIFLKKLSTFYKNNIFLNKLFSSSHFFSNKIKRFFKAKLFSPENKPMNLFLKTYFSFAFLKLIFLQNVFLESFKYFRAPLKIWHLSFSKKEKKKKKNSFLNPFSKKKKKRKRKTLS